MRLIGTFASALSEILILSTGMAGGKQALSARVLAIARPKAARWYAALIALLGMALAGFAACSAPVVETPEFASAEARATIEPAAEGKTIYGINAWQLYTSFFSEIPRSEGGFAAEYEMDLDGDKYMDRAYFEIEVERGFALNRRVVVELSTGPRIVADSTELAAISGWGHRFYPLVADLDGDGVAEVALLIDLGGNGGYGSYGLYVFGADGIAWAAPNLGVEATLAWDAAAGTLSLESEAYSAIIADAAALEQCYEAQAAADLYATIAERDMRLEGDAADPPCDIALTYLGGRPALAITQYVWGPSGVHADHLGFLVSFLQWQDRGTYSIQEQFFASPYLEGAADAAASPSPVTADGFSPALGPVSVSARGWPDFAACMEEASASPVPLGTAIRLSGKGLVIMDYVLNPEGKPQYQDGAGGPLGVEITPLEDEEGSYFLLSTNWAALLSSTLREVDLRGFLVQDAAGNQQGFVLRTETGIQVPEIAPEPIAVETFVEEEWLQGRIYRAASSALGKTYVRGGRGPDTFDSSGLIYYALTQAGVDIPRKKAADYAAYPGWERIEGQENLRLGDILCFTGSSEDEIAHLGVYVGSIGGVPEMIDASSSVGKVVQRSIGTSYWQRHFSHAMRVPAIAPLAEVEAGAEASAEPDIAEEAPSGAEVSAEVGAEISAGISPEVQEEG